MLNQFMLWLKIVKWHVQLMKSAEWNSVAHYSAMTPCYCADDPSDRRVIDTGIASS